MVVLVALGANLPGYLGSHMRQPVDSLRAALVDMVAQGLVLRGASRMFATPCFPPGAGPDYVNAAAAFDADPGHTAADILAILHRVEAAHGRARTTRWAGRVLDLDLLAIDDQVLPDAATHRQWRDLAPELQASTTPDQLLLPHPRMQERAFVLVPLADVAPQWRHPCIDQTVIQMRDALPAADMVGIRPLD
jgi:2-amino-4-hydroxy-6-hydroxymethyldihydropteridine diphosphokinase